MYEALSAYVEVRDGRSESGIARLQRALDDSQRARNVPGHQALVARLLLEACAEAGDMRAGLAAAERALAMGSLRVWEAEAHRLRGEFLAALGGAANAVEVEFERALQVARRQGAQAQALRAAMSLVRFQVGRGDGPAASGAFTLLAAIIDQFPEGRDTHDLREAAAILARR